MRKRFGSLLLTLVVLLATLLTAAGAALAAAPGPDAWTDGPLMPWGFMRFDAHYYAAQNRVYILGGRTGGAATITPDVRYLDVASKTFFTATADLPTGVANHYVVELTDATGPGLFVFGGSTATGVYLTDVQVYRPATDTAAVVAGDTWPGVNEDGCVVFPGAAITYNNKAYLLGGFNGSCATPGVSSETWIYDPMAAAGARFTAGPTLGLARGYMMAAVVDNYLYAIGGDEYVGGSLTVSPLVERLDLSNPAAVWEDAPVADMPVLTASGIAGCDEVAAYGFDSDAGTELDGQIVVAGCGQWSSEYAESFIYDVATNTWADWEALNLARRNYASALVPTATGVDLWVLGGRAGTDTLGTYTTEYRHVALAPTAVKLTGIESRSDSSVPVWAFGLAALVLLAGGVGVARARATR